MKKGKLRFILATFLILLAFWVFMSGLFDAWHLGQGIIACALVAWMSHDLLFANPSAKGILTQAGRFVAYVPWLLYQIVLAAVHVARLALHPRMATLIQPHVIKFRTKLTTEMAQVTFANSITLTPGTITLVVEDNHFYVHAVDKPSADGLPGDMETRVGHIFEEY